MKDETTREERKGDWMQTYTGRKFWPLDPRADEVDIADIAHALSLQCRFAGHCRTFYSVAEHSVRASLLALPAGMLEAARWHDEAERRAVVMVALGTLLHDAGEAYVVDVPRPLKRFLLGYREIEDRVLAAVLARFGVWLDGDQWDAIKRFDEVMLATEARDIMGGESAGKWTLRAAPQAEVIEPWPPHVAERMFMMRFDALTRTP